MAKGKNTQVVLKNQKLPNLWALSLSLAGFGLKDKDIKQMKKPLKTISNEFANNFEGN